MKLTKLLFTIAGACSIVVGASVVTAQNDKRPMMRCEENFANMDTNKDGKVSYAEFSAVKHGRANAEERFNQWDTDKDGFLTKEEFCSKGGTRGNRRGKAN